MNGESLFAKGLIRKVGGVIPKIKILGNGELSVKLSIENCVVSKSARLKIEKALGSIK